MAKVHLEYDTKDKTLSTKMDDKEMPNVREAHFYGYGQNKDGSPKFEANIHMHEHDKDEDVHHVHRVMASEKDSGLTITFVPASTRLESDVLRYFQNK